MLLFLATDSTVPRPCYLPPRLNSFAASLVRLVAGLVATSAAPPPAYSDLFNLRAIA